MWSYYGRKTKVIDLYPTPIYDTIIEPFAGTATYSLYKDNWKKNVILVDSFHKIIKIWWYLQEAQEKDIMQLPVFEYKDKISNSKFLTDEERWLIGFNISRGSARPKTTVQKYNSWNEQTKRKIADSLYKIRHWDIRLDTYENINNQSATWFIDPPYQYGGEHYNNTFNDFENLSKWCLDREGQVIVCENSKAKWLNFKPLKDMNGQLHRTTEVIFTK